MSVAGNRNQYTQFGLSNIPSERNLNGILAAAVLNGCPMLVVFLGLGQKTRLLGSGKHCGVGYINLWRKKKRLLINCDYNIDDYESISTFPKIDYLHLF